MEPNISIREYMRWLPDEAEEPTITVVLTSAERWFVDIRILKPSKEDPPDDNSSNVLLPRRLDWAFAGTSSSELKSTTDGSKIVHSTWHHWIDSRTGNPESIVDEGNMFAQTDGTTLEKGRMVNPATGKMTDYEECWRDVEALSTEASPAAGEKEGLGNGGKRVCTVLQLHDDTNKARGMVIRIGQFVQGVLRVGEAFALERWEWEKKEGWKRSVRIGDLFVPCGVLLGGERVKLGGEVRYGDFGWRVVETSEF